MVNLKLFEKALMCLQGASEPFSWHVGGSFALAYQYQHREVDDLDIVVSDVNFLQSLSPRLNESSASVLSHEDSYEEGSACLMLDTDEGRIFFKVEPRLSTGIGVDALHTLSGVMVTMETPVEIILKRVFYRFIEGHAEFPIQNFGDEDMFDLACVIQKDGALLLQERSIFGKKVRWLDRPTRSSLSVDCYRESADRRIKGVPDEFSGLLKTAPEVINRFLETHFREELIGKEMLVMIRDQAHEE